MTEPKQRVLFVCFGNACRSQMAEGFARAYGKDVLEAASAGIAPASMIPVITLQVMEEKNINLDGQFPKAIVDVDPASFALVMNLSGFDMPRDLAVPVRKWDVPDPMGRNTDFHRQVRDQIEMLVMGLILELRRNNVRGK